jgi:hypothetical protein
MAQLNSKSGLLLGVKPVAGPPTKFGAQSTSWGWWGWWGWDDGDGWDGFGDADGWDGDGWDGWDGDY